MERTIKTNKVTFNVKVIFENSREISLKNSLEMEKIILDKLKNIDLGERIRDINVQLNVD